MAKHTPGPWQWFGNIGTKTLYLGTPHSGRLVVMDFIRWGTQGAMPRFRGRQCMMQNALTFVKLETDYRKDIADINHPDAKLIAAAPDLLKACKKSLKIAETLPCECDDYNGFTCGLHAWKSLLERVIAKAEGGNQAEPA